MKIQGSVVLVTGTNRGIGREYVKALAVRGAAKIYAATRRPERIADLVAALAPKVVPIALDITDHAAVARTAQACPDVQLLVNNAGFNSNAGLLAAPDLAGARAEMETNYFGTLAVTRAFAPVLKANGGGAIIFMASITGRVCLPFMGSLSASKAAVIMLAQGVRAELARQGTRVALIMPGAVDTDMTAVFPPPKMPPADAVKAALDGFEAGLEEVYPGDMATGIAAGLAADPKATERQLAQILPA